MIYLDNNATTKPLPEVIEAMTPLLFDEYANPSSQHQFGQAVRHRVECARAQVANLLGATPREILFTSGGTESINLAIRGLLAVRPVRKRIVTTSVEHSATRHTLEWLSSNGYEVVEIGVDTAGRLDEAAWADAIDDNTALATFLAANNETGVLFDAKRLATIAKDAGTMVHVDAVQTAGKLPTSARDIPADAISISAHKFHGPKGIGAMFLRRRTRIAPLVFGGSQERHLRGGTENVPGIVGMGVAAELAMHQGDQTRNRIRELRDKLEQSILAVVPFARVIGAGADRIHNTTNIAFEHLEAEAILLLLSESGICASSGSACSSGSVDTSHVLTAMGTAPQLARGAVRFSLSRFTTADEIKEVVDTLPALLARLTPLTKVTKR